MQEQILELLSKLISKRTVNYDPSNCLEQQPDGMSYPGEEWKVVEIVESFFKKTGIRYKIFDYLDGRPCIIGYIGRELKGKRRLLIPVHSDTVPSGTGWSICSHPCVEP